VRIIAERLAEQAFEHFLKCDHLPGPLFPFADADGIKLFGSQFDATVG
jgi:hypothetical protein